MADLHLVTWPDGLPRTEEAMRKDLASRGYAVARYVYPAGTVFPDHTHPFDKVDVVVSGTFRVVLGDAERLLHAGDAVVIPAGTVHRAEVVGSEPVVSLDASRV